MLKHRSCGHSQLSLFSKRFYRCVDVGALITERAQAELGPGQSSSQGRPEALRWSGPVPQVMTPGHNRSMQGGAASSLPGGERWREMPSMSGSRQGILTFVPQMIYDCMQPGLAIG